MVRVVRLERTVSWSQTRRDTNFAIPGYSFFCHDTTASGKNKDFSVCGHLCGQRRFCAAFSSWGKTSKRPCHKALRGFALPCPGYRHGTPKASALPTALIPDMKFRLIRRPDVLTQECVYKMTTPQNLTAVHVACRKRTECRRKTILYFTEICRKVKSYIEEAPCPYGHGALILATAAAIAATAVVAAAPTAAAAAAPDDDQQNDDPAAVPAASATVITAHIGTSYEIEM